MNCVYIVCTLFSLVCQGSEGILPFKLHSTVHGLEISYHIFEAAKPTPASIEAVESIAGSLPPATYNKSSSSEDLLVADHIELLQVQQHLAVIH